MYSSLKFTYISIFLLQRLLLLCIVIASLFFLVRLLLYRTALIHVVRKFCNWVDDRIHVHQHFRVPELNHNGQHNIFHRKVYLYLNSLASLEDSDFTNLFSSADNSTEILLYLDDDQVVHDTFLGAKVSWTNRVEAVNDVSPAVNYKLGRRSFVLKIKKKDKRRILRPYLQHIHGVSDDIQHRREEIRLFINNLMSDAHAHCGGCRWRSIPFTHPSTFDSLVMESDLKAKIKSDLDNFLKSQQYYQKLGRVWKRSYLLHGPSGTGKSSFIAAVANYLSFDVYDVDLSRLSDDSDLKMLLLQTASKSIIVVEDLDRFVNERSTVSLSGMLNFMDGMIHSCCGDEKIMMFTVSSKENVDAEMLRPGRIDVHIQFPQCDFNSFKSLANNYLGVKEHKLFPQVEEMFQSGATMSPAEIGELMLMHRSSPRRALKSVISVLQSKSGEGRSSGTKIGRRSNESMSSPLAQLPTEEHGSAAWRESPGKEFRKLYGLLRLKSSRKFGPLDHDAGMIER